ncbi:serine/arginine-rich splicing factor 5-like isoform X3 [Narcine bancroftii]
MSSRVFIGRLSPHATERNVEKFFKGYGRIKEIDLKNGFGFVEFEDYRDAEDAVYELDGKELCNERVTVEHARARPRGGRGGGRFQGRFSQRWSRSSGGGGRNGPPVRTDNRVIVENLSSRVSWQDLKDFMRQAGEVTFADAHRHKLNEGIVEFASYSDLKNALDKLSGTELNGRRIRLIEERKQYRSRSRSRSRTRSSSRSRSRTRSRSRSRGRKSYSRSKSRSRSKTRSRSRSPAPAKEQKGRSPSPAKSPPSAERPRSHSRSQSRSRSKSRSRSRSRSGSPSAESAE